MRRVLIVEDSQLARSVLERVLRQAGFEVLEAADGAEGAVVAMREQPDAVVTDLEMPTMDGYQLARLLKSDPATAHIPVVILTSHQEAPSRFWGLETGADAYLTKNEIQERLPATVERLIRAAPPGPENPGIAPSGPREALARVARHLDQSLREATLIGAVLEKGAWGEDLADTRRLLLETLSALMDAHLLGLVTVDVQGSNLHLDLLRPVPSETIEELVQRLQAGIGLLAGPPDEVMVEGEVRPGARLDLEDLVVLDLPFRDASGALVVLPVNLPVFQQHSLPLLESLKGHLALTLDNARLAQRLRELSNLDGLTRLLNHRAILERLEQELERARRHNLPLSVALCDVDHFKGINDSHGHLAGDRILRELAATLRGGLRATDVVGRYGGEEFLMILDRTDLAAGIEAAKRLRQMVAATMVEVPGGMKISVTASFGVAACSELGKKCSIDRLLALADQRLYEAKAAGRNAVIPASAKAAKTTPSLETAP